MTNNLHKFNTIQDIADEIGIKRQTLYNRAKKTGVDISKKSFSDEEWYAIVNNEKIDIADNVNDVELTKIDILEQRINEQFSFIETLKSEIKAKNVQIDQAQKLQLIAEQRLTETNKDLIYYKEKDTTKKKTFWQRLFS